MIPTHLSPHQLSIRSGPIGRIWFSKRGAKLAAWLLLAAVALYRLAIFIPQPLDGPHTLRPILNAWFDVFLRLYESPEAAYESWRACCLFALLVPVALAVLSFLREQGILRLPDRAARVLCSRGLLFGAIAGALLLCRFPTLLDYQLNPDEGQFLSAAHKLFYESNYFDSVDAGTSGPLNIYPMMLPAILGLSPDFASSRTLVLLIVFGVIYISYRTVRLLAADSVARMAILPITGALTVLENPNLVHYSSEQIPVLLISLALYLAVRVLQRPAVSRVPVFLLGFLTCCGFFAKMQSVPIIGAIAAVAIVYTYTTGGSTRFRLSCVTFIAGTLPLQLLNAAMSLAAGAWTNFWMSYIITNYRYTDTGSNFVTELPRLAAYFFENPEVGYFLFTFLALGASYAVTRSPVRKGERESLLQVAAVSAVIIGALMTTLGHADFPSISAYLLLIVIFLVPLAVLLSREHGSFGTDPVRWFGLLSLVMIAAAVFSLYRPHRFSPGYPLFLFQPFATAMAWMLIRQAEVSPSGMVTDEPRYGRPPFALLLAILALSQATFLWGIRDPHRFRTTAATIRQSEGDFIRSVTSPEGSIFVWGWTADPYLGSGRVPATRDLNLANQFFAAPEVTAYYRARMMRDLRRDAPELIIDAIGTNSWAMEDRGIFGPDQMPEFAHFLNRFYRHIGDGYGERFFLRADLMGRTASVKMPVICAPAAMRCMASPRRFYGEGVTTPVMDDLPPLKMPEHALVEVEFTPFGPQTADSTILNNEATTRSFRGFRLQNTGGDRYQLLVGLGDRWARSEPIRLPDSKTVWLSIEFQSTEIRIKADGAISATMHLPMPMADGPGPIKIGSWIGGACRFNGTIQFFQVVDLTAK
jgi:hypothetical protein